MKKILFSVILLLGLCFNAQAKIPVILDTDMGFDDWMALMYLLKSPEVDLKAVTINCNGLTYCEHNEGAINASRLLTLAGRSDVPIYVSKVPKRHPIFNFSPFMRNMSSKMAVPGFSDLPFSASEIHPPGTAARAIDSLVIAGTLYHNTPVTIISIGTAHNIAQAYKHSSSQKRFRKGLKMIYKGGGAIGAEVKINGAVVPTNFQIQGNLLNPGTFMTNNDQAAWNIYADAESMQTLFASGLPITLIPINVSREVPFTKKVYDQLVNTPNPTKITRFVSSVMLYAVNTFGGWGARRVKFWDPSTIAAALHSDIVTQRYDNIPMCANTRDKHKVLKVGDTRGYYGKKFTVPFYAFHPDNEFYHYGATLINSPYIKSSYVQSDDYALNACELLYLQPGNVTIDMAINPDLFYQSFVETLTR
jgi:pyrimidine-specific ribonucleoside hydrolase